MPIVETYYLIDFENVHEDGLSGSEKLESHDHVHLFSTKNAPKISIEKLTDFNSVDLSSHEIPVGNQSLDMHLVSYLGYLIGSNINKKCKYVIISKDTDYDNIISFWKVQNNSNITRRDKIANISHTQSKVKQKTSTTIKDDNPTNKNNKITVTAKKKTQLNTNIQRAISNAGYSPSTINKVASIVVKHYGEDGFANNVHNDLKKNYSDYSSLYKIVKPVITQYSPTTTKKARNSSNNNEIQNKLNKAGFDNDVIVCVTSFISKYHNEKNVKQTIYRTIVAKYGQKRGLNIYNNIKNFL